MDSKPLITVIEKKEQAIVKIRQDIITSLKKTPSKSFVILGLLWDDASKCFPNGPGWDSAIIQLDYDSMSLFVDLSTYPGTGGHFIESTCSLSAEELCRLAKEYNFPDEYKFMETDADWKSLFNEELCNVIEGAKQLLLQEKAKVQ